MNDDQNLDETLLGGLLSPNDLRLLAELTRQVEGEGFEQAFKLVK